VFDRTVSELASYTLQLEGLENLKQLETMFWKGFLDWHEAIEDIIAEGDKVWIRYRVAGTNTGESSYSGITLVPTGKKIAFTAVSIYRIVNGKLVEGWDGL
jgi:predicted ester cyclase